MSSDFFYGYIYSDINLFVVHLNLSILVVVVQSSLVHNTTQLNAQPGVVFVAPLATTGMWLLQFTNLVCILQRSFCY